MAEDSSQQGAEEASQCDGNVLIHLTFFSQGSTLNKFA